MQSGREDNLEARYAIKFCVKLGKSAAETSEMLTTAYGPSFMSQATIYRWHRRFREGREQVRDDDRSGRERDVRTPELIDQIELFLNEDRHASLRAIATHFEVGEATVHRVVHEDLNMRKVSAKFVPKVLSEEQKQSRVEDSKEMIEFITSNAGVLESLVTCDESWIYRYDPESKRQSAEWKHFDSPRPRKARRSRSVGKLMMIPFFDCHGIIYIHWVPNGQTVNKEYYVEVLREFRKRFRRKRPEHFHSGQWHLHQDNAPCHKSLLVTNYLTEMGVKTVPHPPYSPDLAPCDFWMFPKLKEKLRGRRFEDVEEMQEAVTSVLDSFHLEDFKGAFQKWLDRYKKCVDAGGSYFEGD